jgi:hypothetical protein
MQYSGKHANTGMHNKVTLLTDDAPSEEADAVILYAKDVSDKAELFVINEDGDEIQITFGGQLSSVCPTAEPPVLAHGMIWMV